MSGKWAATYNTPEIFMKLIQCCVKYKICLFGVFLAIILMSRLFSTSSPQSSRKKLFFISQLLSFLLFLFHQDSDLLWSRSVVLWTVKVTSLKPKILNQWRCGSMTGFTLNWNTWRFLRTKTICICGCSLPAMLWLLSTHLIIHFWAITSSGIC